MVNVLSLCFSALFLSNLALTGASDSRGRRRRNLHAEEIQKRAAEEHYGAVRAARSGSTLAAAVARKRAVGGRCKGRNSTTTTTSTTTSTTLPTDPIDNPGGDPTPTSTRSRGHRTRTLTTTDEEQPTSSPPPATTTKADGGNGGNGGGGGGGGSGTYSGEGTYYGTGLGSCGWTNKDSDYIAAVSQLLYDTWPGATDNPNNNPICGRHATAYYGGKSVRVMIVDRCVGCAKYDLDFSPVAFDQLADQTLGRIKITWDWS